LEKHIIEVYSYVTLVCKFKLPLEDPPQEGDSIEVDFDDLEVEFLEGAWGRMTGLYGFKIHGYGFESHHGPAYSQLEMEDEEL
jgi:hypothetical protein